MGYHDGTGSHIQQGRHIVEGGNPYLHIQPQQPAHLQHPGNGLRIEQDMFAIQPHKVDACLCRNFQDRRIHQGNIQAVAAFILLHTFYD